MSKQPEAPRPEHPPILRFIVGGEGQEIKRLRALNAELLDALEFYLKAWDGGETSWFKHCYEVEQRARAAIAKATGEPHA